MHIDDSEPIKLDRQRSNSLNICQQNGNTRRSGNVRLTGTPKFSRKNSLQFPPICKNSPPPAPKFDNLKEVENLTLKAGDSSIRCLPEPNKNISPPRGPDVSKAMEITRETPPYLTLTTNGVPHSGNVYIPGEDTNQACPTDENVTHENNHVTVYSAKFRRSSAKDRNSATTAHVSNTTTNVVYDKNNTDAAVTSTGENLLNGQTPKKLNMSQNTISSPKSSSKMGHVHANLLPNDAHCEPKTTEKSSPSAKTVICRYKLPEPGEKPVKVSFADPVVKKPCTVNKHMKLTTKNLHMLAIIEKRKAEDKSYDRIHEWIEETRLKISNYIDKKIITKRIEELNEKDEVENM